MFWIAYKELLDEAVQLLFLFWDDLSYLGFQRAVLVGKGPDATPFSFPVSTAI